MTLRILFADKFPDAELRRLAGLGHESVLRPELTAAELPDVIAGYDALVVRSTRVERETVVAGDTLRLILRAGAGTNTIDLAAAAEIYGTSGRDDAALTVRAIKMVGDGALGSRSAWLIEP